jgi:hypothetical protein
MAFLVSPGVQIQEKDLSNVVPAVASSIGACAGPFKWGPSGVAVIVSSENDLVTNFGKPDASVAVPFLTAASFLKYGNTLKVTRAVNSSSYNALASYPVSVSGTSIATGSGTAVQITNSDVFANASFSTSTSFISRYPGALGNGLWVTVFGSTSNNATTASDAVIAVGSTPGGGFDYKPTTTDEIHVLIQDDGSISGTAGTVLERWQGLSLYTDSKRVDGTNNYYKDYINRNSAYVWVNTLKTAWTAYGSTADVTTAAGGITGIGSNNGITFDLGTGSSQSVGADGTITSGDVSTALSNVFADAATIDVNLLFACDPSAVSGAGATTFSAAEHTVQTIVSARKDAIGFISAPLNIWQQTLNSSKLTAVLNKFLDSSATRDPYSVFDSTPLYVYNKYQDNYVWIPACGHMAGLCANTDTVADAWFSPAGYNRGNLKGVTKLGYNADQAGRDALYQISVNPIVSFPGQGILLFGDKTAQSKPSAFDRINVRRLFIILEKAIATAAKYQLFELNDQFTQAMFRNMTEPFLRDVQGRRGITDFLVVCDSTNNTPNVVDSNQFVADIYIKPARSINFITLNFIATRTGVSFSEIAGASNA